MTSSADLPSQEQPSSFNKWGVLLATLLGSFTVFLNNSMMNVALPVFMQLFDRNAADAQWVITGFMIALVISMTLTGYLGNRLGHKNIYMIGLCVFLTGSIMGSIGWDFWSIVLARVLQGLGGGIIMPLTMVLIFQHFPLNERGLATGIWGIASMVAPAVGPTLGGFVLEVSRWNTLFLLNIPSGLICLACVAYFLRNRGERIKLPFDIWGFVFVAVGIVSFLVGVKGLQELTPDSGWTTYGLIGLGLACLASFILIELRSKNPLLELRVFKEPIFASSIGVVAFTTVAMFSGMIMIPLLLQEVLDYSALTTGLVMLPQALCMGLGMTVGGRILDKHGPRVIIPTGMVMVIICHLIFYFWVRDMGLWAITLVLMIRGFSLGLVNIPSTTAGLNALPEDQVPRASAINNICRQLTSATGVVFITIFFEMRRAAYSTSLPAQEAGYHAVEQSFLLLAMLVVLALPMALRLRLKEPVPVPASAKEGKPV